MGAHPAKGNLGDICGFLAAGGKWVSEGRGPPPKVSSAIRAGLWRIKVRFQQDRRKETGWPQGRRLVTSDAAAGKIKDILHDLEEIQEKLRENFSWKEAPEAPTQREHLEAQSSSSCPMSDQSPALRRASHFAQWAINPTFNLKSLSCSLEVSRDFHTVTVSPRPQPYRGSCERFSTSQVLCSQALSSGKHYWEVDTRNCSHWAVGVASWEMSRDQVLGRTTDSCCVEWKGTNQLSAWHMVKETVLGSDRPGVVGIWLNLEEGKLAFYSVDNQEKLLYECTISASSPLHPAFWLYGLHPGNYLIIKQVKV
uniref:Ring finger protein 135 n=1 Tax=Callithrix jacchus TaxID=9483 RepID=A0A8I3WWT1_CALJA